MAERTCSVDECERPASSRGMCSMHYKRCRRNGTPDRVLPDHGMSRTPEHLAWAQMRARCSNPAHQNYDYYGGRGITVCPEWAESFLVFYADMGPRPSPQHSLDRIDNDGNYAPGNCRWATRSQQMQNTRRPTIGYNGAARTITGWARETGINRATIGYRLARGLPLAEVFEPSDRRKQAKP